MDYKYYLEEYIDIANSEMDDYLTEAGEELSHYLKDNLQKVYIDPALKKPKVRELLIEYVGTYIDRYSLAFSTPGPVHMAAWTDKDKTFLYDIFGLDLNTLMGLITEMFNSAYPNMAVTHIVREAPYKILVTSLIISAMELNYDEMVECGLYIFGFIEYPLMHHKFWEYGVKEDVMNYTIEHLPSKKFKATKVKNILELVKYDMDTAYNRSKGILVTGLDQPYLKFINTLRDQIKSTFKNIARQYYPNYENNKTQHNQGGQFDDGSLADNDGFSTNIASKIENTYTKISTSELNKKLVDITSNANKTDNSIVSGHISQIIASKNNDLYKFIENVITVYFQKNPTETSIGTATFINFGFTLYRSLSSSKNEMYLKLRLILNKWMFDIIDIKKDYQREATIISYTKSIFDYFILLINYYN